MKTILYITIVGVLASCTSRTIYKEPDDLIPKEQMVDLWTDIYIAGSAKSVKNKRLERKVNYMPFIYEKYKIDSARFMRSNVYYTSKIEVYEELFQEVERKIKDLRDTYDPDMAGVDLNLPIWKRDSIRRARQLQKREEIVPEALVEEDSLNTEVRKP